MPAVDALALVNLAEAGLFVHGDGADRAGLLAGTHLMHDDLVGAVLCAHAAFPAFLWVDMSTDSAVIPDDRNCTETAGLIAGVAETAVTVIRHGIG